MLVERGNIRWLIDHSLPQLAAEKPDTLPITQCGREVLIEALKRDRWVVTGNPHLLDSRTVPFNCPPIVIIDSGLCTEQALRRNLLHFEFCLLHGQRSELVEGQRFLIELDRAIYRLPPEGGLEDFEAWRTPSVKNVLAWGATA